jgi:hypothetical protein
MNSQCEELLNFVLFQAFRIFEMAPSVACGGLKTLAGGKIVDEGKLLAKNKKK